MGNERAVPDMNNNGVDGEPMQDPYKILVEHPELKLRLELWKKEEEVVNQRIERKEQRFLSTKNEVYQLLGIYFVFQGVILTALAQATNLGRALLWIPFVLSLLASLSTIIALWYKLGDCSDLDKQIQSEKKHSKALYQASDRLKNLETPSSVTELRYLPRLAEADIHKERETWFEKMWYGHMGAYGALVIGILLVFSVIMAISCLKIYTSSCKCKT